MEGIGLLGHPSAAWRGGTEADHCCNDADPNERYSEERKPGLRGHADSRCGRGLESRARDSSKNSQVSSPVRR